MIGLIHLNYLLKANKKFSGRRNIGKIRIADYNSVKWDKSLSAKSKVSSADLLDPDQA